MSRVTERLNRREVLGGLGALGLTGIGVALAPDSMHLSSARAADVTSQADHDDMAMTTNLQSETPTADEMDAMHEAGVKAFPAATQGKGGQPLEFTMDGDTKVFKITARRSNGSYSPVSSPTPWDYNGMVPGPEIRVTEGDKVRFDVTNTLPESTSIHWHGIDAAEQHGWRALRHATADQAGRNLYLRISHPEMATRDRTCITRIKGCDPGRRVCSALSSLSRRTRPAARRSTSNTPSFSMTGRSADTV